MRQGEFRTGAWESRWRDIGPWLEQGDLHSTTDPKFRAEEIAEILGIDRESNKSRILI